MANLEVSINCDKPDFSGKRDVEICRILQDLIHRIERDGLAGTTRLVLHTRSNERCGLAVFKEQAGG